MSLVLIWNLPYRWFTLFNHSCGSLACLLLYCLAVVCLLRLLWILFALVLPMLYLRSLVFREFTLLRLKIYIISFESYDSLIRLSGVRCPFPRSLFLSGRVFWVSRYSLLILVFLIFGFAVLFRMDQAAG